MCFQSHKKVSLKLHEKFDRWLKNWNKDNVNEDMEKRCSDWLMGESDDMKPCLTFKRDIVADTVSPYYTYSKYKVKMLKDTDSEPME